MNYLQHTFEIYETIETYACNIRFQPDISLLLRRIQTCWHVEFTRASALATLVGGKPAARRGREASLAQRGGEAAAAQLEESNHMPRLAGPTAEHRDLEEAVRRAWQGR
jgi:hypothetical protein